MLLTETERRGDASIAQRPLAGCMCGPQTSKAVEQGGSRIDL